MLPSCNDSPANRHHKVFVCGLYDCIYSALAPGSSDLHSTQLCSQFSWSWQLSLLQSPCRLDVALESVYAQAWSRLLRCRISIALSKEVRQQVE